ncbi:MAG: RNA recognition motif domain-containing protein [Terriglobales bacterium]
MKKLYVGNLAFSATETELREMFAPFGAVESVSLVTDRDTGRSRGFGFVEMANDAEAATAITGLDGKDSGRTSSHGQRGATEDDARWRRSTRALLSGGVRQG